MALAAPQAALPSTSGPGWLDDYNLPISPTLIIQSEFVLRIGKVCSERQPGYDGKFVPLFAGWKAAHLQSLAVGEAEFRSIPWPPGVTPEAALVSAGDGFELEIRGSPAEKVALECASVLAELEDKTSASK